MRCVGHKHAYLTVEMRYAYTILVGEPDGKVPVGDLDILKLILE
jgi:hypothetical protein